MNRNLRRLEKRIPKRSFPTRLKRSVYKAPQNRMSLTTKAGYGF